MTAAQATQTQAPTFSLALALAVPEGELRAWFAAAGAGEAAVYATGIDLPRAAPSVVLVTRWKDAGLVTTHQQRDPHNARRWQFLVRKAGDAGISEDPRGAALTPARVPLVAGSGSLDHATRAQLGELLDILRRCASRGEPCPSNATLRKRLSLPGASERQREQGRARIKYLMQRLSERGAIEIDCRGRNAARVVTIRAAGPGRGKSTGEANG